MADSLVDSAVKKLEELAFQELKLQTKVGKKVQGLKDDLAWLRALLRHADQRRRQEINEYIELWVRQTREVAFDAEDLLDEYFHRGRLHCHGVLDLPSFLRWLRNGAVALFVRHSICDNIDDIRNRLEEIKKKTEEHDLKSIPSTWAHPQKHYVDWDKQDENSMGAQDKLVGDFEEIDTWLKDQEKQIVLAISGKSGVGKTKLARCIYERAGWSKFDCKVWVHIPQKFRVEEVLGEIIQGATGVAVTEPEKKATTKTKGDSTSITSKLAETLRGKKYLIVLDDVRSLEEWNFFLAVLPDDGKKGSRVVITTLVKPTLPDCPCTRVVTTTQVKPIAPDSSCKRVVTTTQVKPSLPDCFCTGNHQDTSGRQRLYQHVELKKLPEKDDYGRKIFCRKVFGKEEFPDDFRNKDTHSNDIQNLLQHCLPLSATLLAGLLRTKTEEEWDSVIKPLQKSKKEKQLKEKSKKEKQLAEKESKKEKQIEEKKEENSKQEEKKENSKQEKQLEEIEEEKKSKQENQLEEIEEEEKPKQEKQLEEKEEEEVEEEEEEEEGEDKQKQKAKKKKRGPSITYRQQPLVDKILMLSFDDLPPRLKQCFLYLAAFKAEAHIASDKLIRLWVAEGLVRTTDGRTMEEHGQDYLKMLIARCLINLVDVGYNNNIVTVSIHEYVLAFARSEAQEASFLHVRSNTNGLSSATIRRLSIQNTFDPHTRLTLAAPKLRSLLCEIPRTPSDEAKESMESCLWPCIGSIFRKMSGLIMGRTVSSISIYRCKFLRVIDLNGGASASLPEEIGWLICLRYLGLAHTRFRSLPESVAKLRNLETLDITNTQISAVPEGFWKIKSLRHVLARCLNKDPRRIDALDNLQTLHGVPWGQWARKGAALKKMTNLRSLRVWRLSKGHHCDYLLFALTSLECLLSLEIADSEEGQEADLEANEAAANLEATDSKPKKSVDLPLNELLTMTVLRHLQYLRLRGQVKRLAEAPPEQIHSYHLPNLTKLELYKSGLGQAHIYMIANLPNLAEFILGEGSYIDDDMVIRDGGFRELRRLHLQGLPKLKTWEVADENGSTLSHLERVTIITCTKLTKIPEYLQKLKNLVLLTFHEVPGSLMPHPFPKFSSTQLKIQFGKRV